MRYLYTFMLAILMPLMTWAQTEVTGTVTDESDGTPLAFVNVAVKGTSTGAITDIDGKFTIQVNEENGELIFSYIGYNTQTVAVNNRTVVNVALVGDATQLESVVVTALGIEREERSLGYAVSQVNGDELTNTPTTNLMSSLNGKVAGMQITSTGGGAGASTRVIIRGNAKLDGNNQPLYVVDGVPISNSQFQDSNGGNGGTDTGNGMSAINPDDVASISVLKGASASALYGSRAINGVVLITTKGGSKDKGLGIDYNFSTSFDQMNITPEEQEVFAVGNDGSLPINEPGTTTNALDNTSMWGPQYSSLNGDYNTFYHGLPMEVKFHDNYKSFFRTGRTTSHSVAVSNGNENGNFRLSFSNLGSQAMVVNSRYDRSTFNFRGTTKMMNDKLSVNARATYVNEKAKNRIEQGGSVHNYQSYIMGLPSSTDVKWLQQYKTSEGLPIGYNKLNSNPYWTAREVKQKDEENRLIGMVDLSYELMEGLSLKGRAGIDFRSFRMETQKPQFTPYFEGGRAFFRDAKEREENYDLILSYHKEFGDFDLSANAGTSLMYQFLETSETGSGEFPSEDFQNPNDGANKTLIFGTRERQINSVFGTATVGYKGVYYLDVTARNDWSSTLPVDNNSYFYSSVSGSWVFSDMDWNLPSWISFGKMRASWAQVGSDTDPYRLYQSYELNGDSNNGYNAGGIKGNELKNYQLKPEIQSSWEAGLDMRFLNDRLGFDLSWYQTSTVNQIIKVNISNSSGFSNAIINAGEIANKGVELSLYGKPVQAEDFQWEVNLNGSFNKNEVIELSQGVKELGLGGGSYAREGEEYGVLKGSVYDRDDHGNIIVTAEGKPKKVDGNNSQVIGNGYPNWMAGIRNTLTYKNFSFSFLIDGKFGHDIYSTTNAAMYGNGKHEDTVEPRLALEREGEWRPEGIVDVDGNPFVFTENAQIQSWFGGQPTEKFIYDGSFLKLREISLNYNLPSELLKKVGVRKVSLTGSISNVGYLWKNGDNFDPESTYSTGNGQGVEYTAMPLPRTYTLKLSVNL